MGSKGGAAPPPPPLPSVVCCMCGDHGLTQQLFRCKVCLVRSQHRYCSDLYPKAESYPACNWCLREEGSKSLNYPKEAIKDSNSSSISSSNNNEYNIISNGSSSSSSTGSGGVVKLHRGAFSSQLNKPIKKPRMLDRSTSDVTDRIRTGELTTTTTTTTPSSGRARQVVFRGKVRRYKLLEEVSS